MNVWAPVNPVPSKKIVSLTRKGSDKSTKEQQQTLPKISQPTSLAQKCAKASQSQNPISKVNQQSLLPNQDIGPLQRPPSALQANSVISIGAQRGLQNIPGSPASSPSPFSGKVSPITKVDNAARYVILLCIIIVHLY